MVSRLIQPQPHRRCRRMSIFISAFGFGLVSTAVIAIAAVGFTMQFGITNLINLAYAGVLLAAPLVALRRHHPRIALLVGVGGGRPLGPRGGPGLAWGLCSPVLAPAP